MSKKTPRRHKGFGPAAFFIFVLFVIAAALAFLPQYWHLFFKDPDHYKLSYERNLRHMLYRSGLKLLGTPDFGNLEQRLEKADLVLGAPVFIRIFKREFLLELWMKRDNTFRLFASYPICRYSGWLGPKLKQGDHQAPEGVYTVSKSQLNPASRWYRAFNLGFPNRFDRAHGRTGSYLMVHGGCSSVGCYAMTNAGIAEIWKLVTAALDKGQERFQVQVFPFRMTKSALAKRKNHRWISFWQQLKPAFDIFEATKIPPTVKVCQHQYRFERAPGTTNGSAVIANSCKGVNAG